MIIGPRMKSIKKNPRFDRENSHSTTKWKETIKGSSSPEKKTIQRQPEPVEI